ncbi:hypothetical protein K466DRAFT_231071 [Polyporus arcularius HHB13444]|uniref:Uncharacterized protein n=1 Tax=Polyporus arcularius HHB13444 TaxID=1314778 RepID=A0A5C3P3M4_9APHY|nr:hypothetical protein K466DRAFT_231071 [Polyporus arcularius HHB13444]
MYARADCNSYLSESLSAATWPSAGRVPGKSPSSHTMALPIRPSHHPAAARRPRCTHPRVPSAYCCRCYLSNHLACTGRRRLEADAGDMDRICMGPALVLIRWTRLVAQRLRCTPASFAVGPARVVCSCSRPACPEHTPDPQTRKSPRSQGRGRGCI